ncbi:hypothetical protein BS17DRAFT_788482 [Gyrodon lividus]|nr:hypothetical protein BS17DRAFT_788482 [Gyrodon lividus]
MNAPSTASLVPLSSKPSQPQKDYSAAFGELQSQYGLGVHLPNPHHIQSSAPPAPTTSNPKKWYKWGSSQSSSAASIINTPTNTLRPSKCATPPEKVYEAHLGQLMAEYGHGGAFPQARGKK